MKKIVYGLSSLLILVIVFFSGYLIYIGRVKNMLQYHEIDINTSYVQNIYHSISLNNNLDSRFDFYTEEKMNNSYLLNLGIQNIYSDSISFKDIQKKLKDLTIYQSVYPHSICGYDYIASTQSFIKTDNCNFTQNYNFYTQLSNAKENDVELILEEKNILYTKDLINGNYFITLYKDTTQKEVIDYINISEEVDLNQLINNYMDKASTYQYTFDKKNNHYIFKGIKKI